MFSFLWGQISAKQSCIINHQVHTCSRTLESAFCCFLPQFFDLCCVQQAHGSLILKTQPTIHMKSTESKGRHSYLSPLRYNLVEEISATITWSDTVSVVNQDLEFWDFTNSLWALMGKVCPECITFCTSAVSLVPDTCVHSMSSFTSSCYHTGMLHSSAHSKVRTVKSYRVHLLPTQTLNMVYNSKVLNDNINII